MFIPYSKIVEMIKEARSAGVVNSGDSAQQIIEEIFVKNGVLESNYFRIYTVNELNEFPCGSKFFHPFFGEGVISSKYGLRKQFMTFREGSYGFLQDIFPWDLPIAYVGDE